MKNGEKYPYKLGCFLMDKSGIFAHFIEEKDHDDFGST